MFNPSKALNASGPFENRTPQPRKMHDSGPDLSYGHKCFPNTHTNQRSQPDKPIRRRSGALIHLPTRWLPAGQYSRSFFRPGIGTGYKPLASASTGGGESIVHLSMSGAYSWGWFSMSS